MYLIVFCAFLASNLVSVRPQDNEVTIAMWINAEKECLPKFPNEMKDVLHELKIKRVLPDNPPDDFKCLMDCMGRSMGVIDEQGNFHGEKMKSLTANALKDTVVTPEEIHLAVEECSKVAHDVSCEKAHMYLTCKHDKFKHIELHDDMKVSTGE